VSLLYAVIRLIDFHVVFGGALNTYLTYLLTYDLPLVFHLSSFRLG